MTFTHRRARFIILTSLAIVAVVTILAGSVWAINATIINNPETDQTTTDPAESDAEGQDANVTFAPGQEEELALYATKIMTTWTPTNDDTQTAAELRARPLMTDEAANRIEEPERAPGGADWRRARETNATSQPAVEISTGTEGEYITVLAQWQWIDDTGQTSWKPDEQRAYHFTFTEENGDLKIADYTYEVLQR